MHLRPKRKLRTTTWSVANWWQSYLVITSCENSEMTSNLATYKGYDGKIISGTTSLVSGLQYYYQVHYRLKSNGANADSDYSNKITANTSIDAPTTNAATSRTTTSFTANWNAVSGVNNYKLHVSENSIFSSHLMLLLKRI